jgi:uncharacterized protein YwgA
MLKEHAKLLVLFQEAGEVIGRKKLQKIVYISKKFRFDFQEKFNFHFYGPYSEELSLQIEELTNLGFIKESKENKGGYSQYKYELSKQGREYLGIYPTEMEGYDQFVGLVNQESSRFLELVSTMLYFDKLDKEEMIEKIGKVKSRQNYSVEELEKALEFCESLMERFSHLL